MRNSNRGMKRSSTCMDTYIPRVWSHVPYSKRRIREPRHDHPARRSVRDGRAREIRRD
jgi:hypothetical protein